MEPLDYLPEHRDLSKADLRRDRLEIFRRITAVAPAYQMK